MPVIRCKTCYGTGKKAKIIFVGDRMHCIYFDCFKSEIIIDEQGNIFNCSVCGGSGCKWVQD